MRRWVWPEATSVQAVLRDRAMQMLTAPNDHAHEPTLEVRAELQTTGRVSAVSAAFPAEFRRVLVVSYRPNQTWAEMGDAATEIMFE